MSRNIAEAYRCSDRGCHAVVCILPVISGRAGFNARLLGIENRSAPPQPSALGSIEPVICLP